MFLCKYPKTIIFFTGIVLPGSFWTLYACLLPDLGSKI